MYETVKLHGEYGSGVDVSAHEKAFVVALNSRPPSFFERHVKNLCLTEKIATASHVLPTCTGVLNLALWGRIIDVSPIFKLRLRSLDTHSYNSRSREIGPHIPRADVSVCNVSEARNNYAQSRMASRINACAIGG